MSSVLAWWGNRFDLNIRTAWFSSEVFSSVALQQSMDLNSHTKSHCCLLRDWNQINYFIVPEIECITVHCLSFIARHTTVNLLITNGGLSRFLLVECVSSPGWLLWLWGCIAKGLLLVTAVFVWMPCWMTISPSRSHLFVLGNQDGCKPMVHSRNNLPC